jgi:hypothetical protein
MDIGPLIRVLLVEPVHGPVPEVIRPVETPLTAPIDPQQQPVPAER